MLIAQLALDLRVASLPLMRGFLPVPHQSRTRVSPQALQGGEAGPPP